MSSRPFPPPVVYKRPFFEPQCTHLSMTRLYDPAATCLHCRRPGPFGWVYQCTQDREEVLEQAAARGELTAFDDLGRILGTQLRIRKRSPAARQDRLSFFSEVTAKQMSSYRPEHVAAILRQRENVHLAIESDRIQRNSSTLLGQAGRQNLDGASGNGYPYRPPWVRTAAEECHYWVCPNCRPSAADRAYLSIDAVVEGEITPTAAVGYGFHVMGERPVVNANLVKTIGCRPVPKVGCNTSSDTSSFGSDLSVMELLDHQIAQVHIHCASRYPMGVSNDDDKTQLLLAQPERVPPGCLRHSPRCDNLTEYSERDVLIRRWPFERPPRDTSLPISVRDGGHSYERIVKRPQTDRHTSDDGIAPISVEARKSACQHDLAARTPRSAPPCIQTHSSYYSNRPSISFNYGYLAPLAVVASGGAQDHQLPNESGEDYVGDIASARAINEKEKFEPAPLKVGHGVAMLEESVELGVPDVITQA